MRKVIYRYTQHIFSLSPHFLLTSLSTLLLVLLLLEADALQRLRHRSFLIPPVVSSVVASYPVWDGGRSVGVPNISAKSVVVMDEESKVVVYSKNAGLRFSTASTAKIMTALVALEQYAMDQILTVKTDYNVGAVVGLTSGQQLTFENMLYAMLLPSGNDAATAIAQNYPGGEKAFVARMNQKAKDTNLWETHFEDATGLLDSNYTTALDLAHLSSIAMKNQAFAKVVGTKHWNVHPTKGDMLFVSNLNKLLGINGVNGVKTGFTDEAGEVLVTSRVVGDKISPHTILMVVMQSEDRFGDTQILENMIIPNIRYEDTTRIALR